MVINHLEKLLGYPLEKNHGYGTLMAGCRWCRITIKEKQLRCIQGKTGGNTSCLPQLLPWLETVYISLVNDYLAKRDSAWCPYFQFHGMSVDCIDHHRPNSEERRKAYNSRYYLRNQ
jgi:hypothetical protein